MANCENCGRPLATEIDECTFCAEEISNTKIVEKEKSVDSYKFVIVVIALAVIAKLATSLMWKYVGANSITSLEPLLFERIVLLPLSYPSSLIPSIFLQLAPNLIIWTFVAVQIFFLLRRIANCVSSKTIVAPSSYVGYNRIIIMICTYSWLFCAIIVLLAQISFPFLGDTSFSFIFSVFYAFILPLFWLPSSLLLGLMFFVFEVKSLK